MPNRILHISQPSEAGVATVLLGYLSRRLTPGGDDLELAVACAPDSQLSTQAQAMGVEVLPWEATRGPGPSVIPETHKVAELVRSWRPDLVHLHSSKAGLAGRLAVRGRIPTVFQPHAWSFEAIDGVSAVLSRQWERRAARWTHVTVCVSRAERAAAPSAGTRTSAHVIPNTVDPARWVVGERTAARARLGLEPGTPYAMCVGRLCEQKGQDSLVALWPTIRARVPQAQLVLIGAGPHAERLRGSHGRGVSLVGPQHAADWYAACDLLVVPSRWEAMAMVPLEAQAAGRMVVGYDVDGMAESLGPDNTLVSAGDHSRLASAVTSALLDLPDTHRRGVQGRDFAVRTWSPDEQPDLLQAAYRQAQHGFDLAHPSSRYAASSGVDTTERTISRTGSRK